MQQLKRVKLFFLQIDKGTNFMLLVSLHILKNRHIDIIKQRNQTCLREIGKVNLEESSGTATISFTIILHTRHTPAQATTLRRDGHSPSSADSTLIRISLSSSSGSSDHRKGSEPGVGEAASWTTRCGLDRISWIKLRIVMREI